MFRGEPVIFLKSLKARNFWLAGIIFLAVLCAASRWARVAGALPQASITSQQTEPAKPPASQQTDAPAAKPDEAAQKPMSPEEARQAQLVADTNRLYQLAQELQAEVAKSTKNTLSLAVVKKAAEVEKLAKNLKERMKTE